MKKVKLLLKILSIIFVLYGFIGFFILPHLIKEQIIENAQKLLTRKVSIESVSCNPYTFEVGVDTLLLHTKEEVKTFAGVREIEINIDPFYLLKGEIRVKYIGISAPFVRVHKNKKGEFNFSDLLVAGEEKTQKERQTRTEFPAFVIDKFSIKSGKVYYLDETLSQAFEETLKPINFTLRDFSTMKEHNNKLSLHIRLDDGGTIDYRGKINSIEPLRLEGSLALHSGRLYTQWEYFRDVLGFIVADGSLDASLEYTADFSAEPMQVNINQYQLRIEDLRLQEKKTKENMLKLPLLSLHGSADLGLKQIKVNKFLIEGFSAKARRDENGVINWLSYLPPSKPSQETNETSPWKINIARLDIKTDELSFEEHFAPKAYEAKVQNLSLGVQDIKAFEGKFYVDAFQTLLSGASLYPLEGKKEYLGFKDLSLNGRLSKTQSMDINLSRVHLDSLNIFALMDQGGKLNFSKLSPLDAGEEKTAESKKGASPLNWEVDHFQLSQASVDFKDHYSAKNALIKLDNINADVRSLSSVPGSWARAELSTRINKTGQLVAKSKLRQSPLAVQSQVQLKGLDLSSFQAYVNKRANIDVNSGILNLDFKAEHNKKRSKILADARIKELNLSERREGKTFFAFSKLEVKKIDFSLNPDQMKIANVDIFEPYARLKIDEKHITNLEGLMLSDKQNGADTEVVKAEKKAFQVFIGKVNFKEGKGEFSDLSLPLPFKTDIHDLNGEMIALGNLSDVKTKVDIDGVVDEYGLAKIEGKLLSASPKVFTDMEVKFQNIDMTNLSPYTGKFIGHTLKEGKMNVELDYKIDDAQMQGGNRIVLKKLTLGEEVESEDAISAPVSLAIALLKDGDGVIDLDVPVSGDVNKPDFAIGHVVWTAFKNLIVGVATAPFKFLGNLLGMSADALENIQFEVGKADILPPEKEKLDKLSEVFSSKKMLLLKVAGSYDAKRDLLAMQTAKLYEEALSKLEDNTTNISLMDRDDLDALMKTMYVSHFGKEKYALLKETIDIKQSGQDNKKSDLRKRIREELIDDQKVSEEDLISLAKRRAEGIISHLVHRGIAADRLESLEPVQVETAVDENEYIPTKLVLGAK